MDYKYKVSLWYNQQLNKISFLPVAVLAGVALAGILKKNKNKNGESELINKVY